MKAFFIFSVGLFLTSSWPAVAGINYSVRLPALGGSDTSVSAVTTDVAGNVYLAGVTGNAGFPVTPGVVQPQYGGGVCTYGGNTGNPFVPIEYFPCTDGFVIKLDSSGNILFSTFLGGRGQDGATSIGVDSEGNIYVAGVTSSGNFLLTGDAVFRGPAATFILKLDPSGSTVLYSAFLPGTGGLPFVAPFQGNVVFTNIAMTVDADGNAYFAANGSPGFPVTDGALETSGPVVAGKLDPTGTQLLYGTYLGGSEPGFGSSIGGIAVDSEGSVYLAGSANTGVFVAKLNPAGTAVVYRTDLGAGSYSHPMQVRVDAAGEAYVLGLVQGPGYPVTGGAFQTTYPLGGCSFLTKLSADGSTLVYSTFLSVTGAPPTGFDVDAAGTAYVGGQTGPGFPVSESAAQAAYGGGGDDVFIAQFTPDGRLGAATYLGGSSYESAFAVAAVSDGSIVVSGVTNSPDFPATGAATAGFFVARLTVAEPAAAGQ